ncbi:hypothetical protein [Bartonella sp. WD16.2]|nr:hypothetical protein [Bartonella sp. WD16.2]
MRGKQATVGWEQVGCIGIGVGQYWGEDAGGFGLKRGIWRGNDE